MRKQAKWMGKWDDRFLEYIYENKSGAPTQIAESEYIPVSKQYVSRRLKELAENGLLVSLGNGVYQISVMGILYLAGDYDAQNETTLIDMEEFEPWDEIKHLPEQEQETIRRAMIESRYPPGGELNILSKYMDLGLINDYR
jgi:hypothetical protein